MLTDLRVNAFFSLCATVVAWLSSVETEALLSVEDVLASALVIEDDLATPFLSSDAPPAISAIIRGPSSTPWSSHVLLWELTVSADVLPAVAVDDARKIVAVVDVRDKCQVDTRLNESEADERADDILEDKLFSFARIKAW
jgi:hypothetical protein